METGSSKEDETLLRFNITKVVHIRLTRLKVYTYSKKIAKPYKCHLCKYSSNFKYSVKSHLRTHTGVKPFACTLCNYKSTQKSNLNRHIMAHTGEKPYNCASCKKSFGQKISQIRHEKSCKQISRQTNPSWIEMKIFKCKLCPHSTAAKYNLNRHVMTHTGEKPFSCTLCSSMFKSGADLRIHIFSHTREKPHSCQFCTRGFAHAASQKSHEKICKLNPKKGDAKLVEEQKKFQCHFCKYRTFTKYKLERHLRSLNVAKLFDCPFCIHTYSTTLNLFNHLKQVHVTSKGYNCPDDECAFTTLLASKLVNHVKDVHGNN